MRRSILCGLVVLAVGCGSSTASNDPQDGGAGTDATQGEDVWSESAPEEPDGEAGSEADAAVAAHCEVDVQRIIDDVAKLASDEWGGRAPGTSGNEAAVAYAEQVFGERGLTAAGGSGSFLQPFQHVIWQLSGTPELTLGDKEATPGTGFTVFSQSGSADVSAEMVFVGYGMTAPPFDPTKFPDCPLAPEGYDDYAGVDVDGKIALMMRHGPGDMAIINDKCPGSAPCSDVGCLWNFDYKAENARLHGAAAMLLVQNDPAAPEVIEAVLTPSAYEPSFAALFLDRRDAVEAVPSLEDWLAVIDGTLQPSSAPTGVNATVRVSAARTPKTIHNVIGVLPGKDPAHEGEVVMVGAHLDHLGTTPLLGTLYPGADDNASGSAVVLELARTLSDCLPKPARSIAFALWNAEEDGLVGSCHYVDAPAIPLNQTYALLNVDMVGGGNGAGIKVFGGELWDQTWAYDVLQGSALARGLDYEVRASEAQGGSDHVCFYNAGVTSLSVQTIGSHPYYHTPNDTFANINTEDLETAGKLLLAGVQSFAEGEEQQYIRCNGSCRDQLHDTCTCDPSDPCGWSNDGVCDGECEQVVGEMFDDTQDCGE